MAIITYIPTLNSSSSTSTSTDESSSTSSSISTVNTVYIDGVNGDDSNDGLTKSTPKKTIEGCLSITSVFDSININCLNEINITSDIIMSNYQYKTIIFNNAFDINFIKYNDGVNTYIPKIYFDYDVVDTCGVLFFGGNLSAIDDGSGLPLAANQCMIKCDSYTTDFKLILDCQLKTSGFDFVKTIFNIINILSDGYLDLGGYLINSQFGSKAVGDISSSYILLNGSIVTDYSTIFNNTTYTQL